MDALPFLEYYRENRNAIVELLDNLADEFSKAVVLSYYEFMFEWILAV